MVAESWEVPAVGSQALDPDFFLLEDTLVGVEGSLRIHPGGVGIHHNLLVDEGVPVPYSWDAPGSPTLGRGEPLGRVDPRDQAHLLLHNYQGNVDSYLVGGNLRWV